MWNVVLPNISRRMDTAGLVAVKISCPIFWSWHDTSQVNEAASHFHGWKASRMPLFATTALSNGTGLSTNRPSHCCHSDSTHKHANTLLSRLAQYIISFNSPLVNRNDVARLFHSLWHRPALWSSKVSSLSLALKPGPSAEPFLG